MGLNKFNAKSTQTMTFSKLKHEQCSKMLVFKGLKLLQAHKLLLVKEGTKFPKLKSQTK